MSEKPTDIEALAALEEKATPIPWREELDPIDDSAESDNDIANVRGLYIAGPRKAVSCGAEVAFIVAMRNALPALLAEIRAARKVVGAARGVFEGGGSQKMLARLQDALSAYDSLFGKEPPHA